MMKFCTIKCLIGICSIILFTCSWAVAGVTPEEAARLKTDLTPMGAQRDGNADGTIPQWQGGLTAIPSDLSYNPGDFYADPFTDDPVLFSITAKNMRQYADKLSNGQKELFEKYPDTYRIDVYPTRRTAAAPEWVYNHIFQNATRTSLSDNGLGVVNTYCAIPFPIPKSGKEVIFNHILRYRGAGRSFEYLSGIVLPNGTFSVGGGGYAKENCPIAYKGGSPENFDSPILKLLIEYNSPERRKGELLLALDYLDSFRNPRKAWQYLPGQRRVRRAPTIAYDNPDSDTGGLETYDGAYMFNGAIDRYNWKILGKKEMYIPYNCYRFHNAARSEVLTARHHNPDVMRWELHRVWAIEAKLKQDKRHAYGKRVFYIDEDTWIALLSDNYDGRGNLWRTNLQTTWNLYNIPAIIDITLFHYDFQKEIYAVDAILNSMDDFIIYDPAKGFDEKLFTPENLRKLGRR